MEKTRPNRTHVVAVLVALAAALVARSALQVHLRNIGIPQPFAADVSYLVVPPLLAILLFPVLTANRTLLRQCFDTSHLNMRLVLNALALGGLLRLAWWCHVVAGVSLGIFQNDDPSRVVGPEAMFRCPPGYALATGVLVMSILVPVIEELLHRGFVLTYLRRHGPAIAVAGSAALFAVYHPLGAWGFVFLAGLVMGAQFWITRSLWPSLITHATINTLVIIDWRCVQGQWNPPAADLPLVSVAVVAISLLVVCGGLTAWLLFKMHRGEHSPR